MYVNGRTELLYTEDDCSYVYITVLKRPRKSNMELKNKPIFLFKLSMKQKIILPLSDNISFSYNGKFITHCQAYNKGASDDNESFYNISAYGNLKIFNRFRKTFQREMNN